VPSNLNVAGAIFFPGIRGQVIGSQWQ